MGRSRALDRSRPLNGTSHRRRFTIDARLLVGAVLVALSVAGVAVLLGAADRTVPLYTAKDALYPGDRVSAVDLAVTRVRLDAGADRYLGPADLPTDGVLIGRAVGEGELLPTTAVGVVDGTRLAPVVIDLSGELSESAKPGSGVDLWAAERLESSRYGAPAVLVPRATLVRVLEAEGLVADSGVAVEVLVPRASVARVLQALANDDAVSAVPSSIPLGG
jgi:hypothetical protein